MYFPEGLEDFGIFVLAHCNGADFVRFLEELKNPKSPFQINQPLPKPHLHMY